MHGSIGRKKREMEQGKKGADLFVNKRRRIKEHGNCAVTKRPSQQRNMKDKKQD